MERLKIRKRGFNRSRDSVISEINDKIMSHQSLRQIAKDKASKTIAYHDECISRLEARRELVVDQRGKAATTTELLRKIHERGMTVDDVLKLVDEMS